MDYKFTTKKQRRYGEVTISSINTLKKTVQLHAKK